MVIVNVYTLCDWRRRRNLWEELSGKMTNSHRQCWCLLGDFNYVHRATERVGLNGQNEGGREKEEFNAFIEGMGLIDLPLVGRSCT